MACTVSSSTGTAFALLAVLLAYFCGTGAWRPTISVEPSLPMESAQSQLHLATLTTYFLAASQVQLVQIDEGQSMYELSFPLSAAAEWTPVTTAHLESGMVHTAVLSQRLLLDWAILEAHAREQGPHQFSFASYAVQSAQSRCAYHAHN
jgi:hypothetical protein